MVEILRWNDLLAYLESNHAGVQTFPGDRLRFAYLVDGEPARYPDGTAIVFGGFVLKAASGSPWLVLALKLAPHEEVRPRPALIANHELPIGAIASLAEFAVYEQSLPLEGLQSTVLEATMSALAKFGGELRAARGVVEGAAAPSDERFDLPYAYIYR